MAAGAEIGKSHYRGREADMKPEVNDSKHEEREGFMLGTIRFVNGSAVLGAIGLILLSVWPGFAIGCLIYLTLPLIAMLGLAWMLVAMLWLFGRRNSVSARQLAVAPVLICLTLAVLTFYIPRRIAFLVFRGQFEQHVASAVVSDYGGEPLGWVGIYRVDAYAADPRGGVYFRTTRGPDGIGPDTMSYGFAYRPNRQGSPFGAAHYGVYRLFGDWHWFRASDDW